MTKEEIILRRLSNQNLLDSNFSNTFEIVHHFGAVQSQDFPAAKWALSQRLNYLDNQVIEKSFNEGDIIRTHVLRPTWHFVHPEDLRWMLNITGDRVKRMMGTYNKVMGLSDEVFEKSKKIIKNAFEYEEFLTRNDLSEILKKEGITWNLNGLAHIIMMAEEDYLICSGPLRGKNHTYALASNRIKKSKNLNREEALKELVKRYFKSHGPAQIQDFTWWSGLLTKDVSLGIEANKDLKREEVEGKTYYYFDEPYESAGESIKLLPNYDEYTVAFRDRSIISPNVKMELLDTRQNVLFNNVILIDGKIDGLWRRTIKPKSVIIEKKLFRSLSISEEKKLKEEFEKYGEFLNLSPIINK